RRRLAHINRGGLSSFSPPLEKGRSSRAFAREPGGDSPPHSTQGAHQAAPLLLARATPRKNKTVMARAEFILGPRFARTRGRATQAMQSSVPPQFTMRGLRAAHPVDARQRVNDSFFSANAR